MTEVADPVHESPAVEEAAELETSPGTDPAMVSGRASAASEHPPIASLPTSGSSEHDAALPAEALVAGLAPSGTAAPLGSDAEEAPVRCLAFCGSSIELRALLRLLEQRAVQVVALSQVTSKPRPNAVVCDLASSEAISQLCAWLEAHADFAVPLITLGSAAAESRVDADRLRDAGVLHFDRPIDVRKTCASILQWASRPSERPLTDSEDRGGALARPSRGQSARAPTPAAEPAAVSAELKALLREAEERVSAALARDSGDHEGPPPLPVPLVELSQDVWDALDQPLDDEDDGGSLESEPDAREPRLTEAPPPHQRHPSLDSLPGASTNPAQPWEGEGEVTSAALSRGSSGDWPNLPTSLPAQRSPTEGPGRLDTRSTQPPAAPMPRATATRTERPSRAAPPSIELPAALVPGGAARVLARAISQRLTGCLTFEVDEGLRRVVLHEGDVMLVVSAVHAESLVAFLHRRGDLSPTQAAELDHRIPSSGRHAGAALIARGLLHQDDLWSALRAHGAWVLGRVMSIARGTVRAETTPDRLLAEPGVFGGAPGAATLIDVVRHTISEAEARGQLEQLGDVLLLGPNRELLSECGLEWSEAQVVERGDGVPLAELLTVGAGPEPAMATSLLALEWLGVIRLTREPPSRAAAPAAAPLPPGEELDIEAWRHKVKTRRALVDQGDYFTLLGVERDATTYAIRAAYLRLRQEFERPAQAVPLESRADVELVLDVLSEAYEILEDSGRRERYRKAIEAHPADAPP